jgi:TolB protein
VSDRDGNPEIYVVNVASGTEYRLTNDLGTDARPAWWFDGSKILWASNRSGNWEIYAADFDAVTPAISNITNLTNNAAADVMPNMRSDGSSIAFATDRDGTRDIWTMDPDGSNQARFARSDAVDDNDPSWSP